MKSRERVRNTLNHKPTDRIPNGLCGGETTGMHVLAYEKLRNILGISGSSARIDSFMVNAVNEMDVLKAMEGDILLIGSPLLSQSPLWGTDYNKYWKETEIWGKTFKINVNEKIEKQDDGSYIWEKPGNNDLKCPTGSLYFDSFNTGQRSYEVPSPDLYSPKNYIPDDILRNLEESARTLYESTDYSLQCGETLTDLQIEPGGIEAWWMCLLAEPEIAHEYLSKTVEASIAQMHELNQAVGKYIDMLSMAHDLGDMRGTTIGADTFRNIYKPHYKKLFTKWHEISDSKINFHSCGDISEIIVDFIECGVDVLNPIQVSAKRMDPAVLKSKYHDRLIFFGGSLDSVATPKEFTYDQVYDIVKKNIEILSKNGGYIFAGVHNIVGDIPEVHLKAMLDAYMDTRDF